MASCSLLDIFMVNALPTDRQGLVQYAPFFLRGVRNKVYIQISLYFMLLSKCFSYHDYNDRKAVGEITIKIT